MSAPSADYSGKKRAASLFKNNFTWLKVQDELILFLGRCRCWTYCWVYACIVVNLKVENGWTKSVSEVLGAILQHYEKPRYWAANTVSQFLKINWTLDNLCLSWFIYYYSIWEDLWWKKCFNYLCFFTIISYSNHQHTVTVILKTHIQCFMHKKIQTINHQTLFNKAIEKVFSNMHVSPLLKHFVTKSCATK